MVIIKMYIKKIIEGILQSVTFKPREPTWIRPCIISSTSVFWKCVFREFKCHKISCHYHASLFLCPLQQKSHLLSDG